MAFPPLHNGENSGKKRIEVLLCVEVLIVGTEKTLHLISLVDTNAVSRCARPRCLGRAHLCEATFVPCRVEALVPVRGPVRPEVPHAVQLLHLSGGGLPGEEHAGVQQTCRFKGSEQAQTTEQLFGFQHSERSVANKISGEVASRFVAK